MTPGLSRLRVTLAPYLLVAVLLVGCGPSAGSDKVAPAPALEGALQISVQARVDAGQPARVLVTHASAPDGTSATLMAQGSYGGRVYHASFAQGKATFLLSGEATRRSGFVTLVASAGAARGAASFEIRPGPPVDPITPLVGARTITADGRRWSMAVAVPFDAYGNPADEGTRVEFRALHPDNQLEVAATTVERLVAWRRIYSRTIAGRTTVSAAAGGARGPDAIFTEVPGWPVSFGLSASPRSLPADGRQFVTLRTDVLRDQFDNAMLDGTLVTFVIDVPGGEPRFIPAYTIDGVAEAQLRAAEQPGVFIARATLYGIESRPLQITFTAGPAVGNFPVTAHVNSATGRVSLDAGPLLGPLAQFVPDGTPVRFQLTGPGGATREIDGEAEQGHARATLELASLAPGNYSVDLVVGSGSGHTTFAIP